MTHTQGSSRRPDHQHACSLLDLAGISVPPLCWICRCCVSRHKRTPNPSHPWLKVCKVWTKALEPVPTVLTDADVQVIRPMLVGPVQSRSLRKPILVIIITDGEPSLSEAA